MGAAVAANPLMAAGAGVGAIGAYQQGQTNAAALRYQAQVARNNQMMAEAYARNAEESGNVEAQVSQVRTGQRVGAVAATAAANGLDVSSGSPLRLTADTLTMGQFDAAMIRHNAEMAAYGYRVRGQNYASDAALEDWAATGAATAGELNAVGSIITGGAAISNRWAQMQQAGMYGAG